MAGLARKLLLHAAVTVEEGLDRARAALTRVWPPHHPVIVAYRGLASDQRATVIGRVLRRSTAATARPTDSRWRNLRSMLGRIRSREVPRAIVRARLAGAETVATADHEGFFSVSLRPGPHGAGWRDVSLELLRPRLARPVRATAQVLVPPARARFAVISDIDDTVMHTDVASLLRMGRAVLLGNAHTRLPFPGVAALFRALAEGAGGEANPLVFVSRSPWNIYDVLDDFFALHDFPRPVLFLRDWGLDRRRIGQPRERHKLDLVHQVLDVWPDLPLILVGDSGQEDPEIYHRVVRDHPGRVLAVWIRNVSKDLERPRAIRALAREVVAAGSTLILADDTAAMAAHAVAQGWIPRTALSGILAETAGDERQVGRREPAPTVVVGGRDADQAAEAIEGGAIEDAIAEGPAEQPPTVIVQPEDRRPAGD